jgi:Alpha-L-arabinofuranosidase B, catalytic
MVAVGPRRKKRWYVIAARPVTTVVPPLDAIAPGAAVAYSYRKLSTAYAGNAANIQRDSDTTNTDIGFSGGNFDAAAYTTFVGGSTGRTRLWYDQSGNAATETSFAGSNGLPVTFSHVPADNGRYGGFTTYGDTQRMSVSDAAAFQNIWATGGFAAIVVRVEAIGSNGNSSAMVSKGTTAGWGIFIYNNAGTYVCVPYFKATVDGFAQTVNTLAPLVLHVVTMAWNASTPTVAPVVTIDGVTCTFSNWTAPTGTFANDVGQGLFLFNDNMLNTLNVAFGGGLFEVILYKSIPAGANQLITNMKNYYQIP